MSRKLPPDELARRKKLQKRQQTLIHMASVRGIYTDVAVSRSAFLDEGEELIAPRLAAIASTPISVRVRAGAAP